MKKHCVRYGYVISLILLVFMTIFFSVRSYHLGKYEGAFSQAEGTVHTAVIFCFCFMIAV